MKLQDLRPNQGSTKNRTRVGRGDASGTGGTAGRGHKGQKSRSGGNVRPGFEGGQTPLYRRVPKKRGFNNLFKKDFAILNVCDLKQFADGTVITLEYLKENQIIKRNHDLLKILGNGELDKKDLTIKANKISEAAAQKLQKAGVKVEIIE